MAEVKDLLAYLLNHYPNPEDLSKARTTKLIYLCDWKHCLLYNHQITSIEWIFDNYGPFVWDVMVTVQNYPELFETVQTETYFGNEKTVLRIKDRLYKPNLETMEKKTADFVIKVTKDSGWQDFIKIIYSTYPVVTSQRHSILDLPKLAHDYKSTIVFEKYKKEIMS